MSFFDDASLVFLPSGQAGKDGKAYSMKPVPEYGSELLSDTNQFDTTWITTNASVTGGQSGYDGSSDAWLLEATNTASILYQIVSSSGVQNISVYAKAGTTDNLVFYSLTSPSVRAGFDLTNGSVNYELRSIDASIEDVGNGWYRCSMVFSGASTAVRIYPADSSLTATIGDNIYIQDASLKEITTQAADFTFSRGSNLTATRVDSNGLIAKGRENLLLQSNQFDTTWSTSNASVTSGQSGYDGSSDAWLLEATGTSSTRVQQTISTDSVQTISVYAKKGTSDYFQIRLTGASTAFAFFDLANGTLGTLSNQVDASITSIGSGWYRCSLTRIGASTSARIYVTGNNTTSVSVGDNIYIQDAQLEQGLVATEYIESGATTGLAGILEDSPRFDYSGGASCPSLLLEPSRTNLIGYSEYLGGLGESGSPNLSLESEINPSGSLFSYKATATTTTSRIQEPIGTQGNNFIFSGFFKGSGVATRIRFRNNQGEGVYYNIDTSGNFTLYSEDIVNDNYGIEDYGNGWKRIYFETTTASGGTNNYLQLYIDVQDGDGSVLVWGLQAEQGSYPTSYIPNHSGGSVTREADVSTLLNQSGVIGQTAGTILFDAYFDEADKVNFSISDSTSSNYILIDTTSGKQVFARVQQGGSTQATISTSGSFFTEGDRLKCAIAYDDRDMSFYINGTQVGTAAPNLIPACDDVRFSRWNGALAADQRVNRVLLFDTRISNNNLATLTS